MAADKGGRAGGDVVTKDGSDGTAGDGKVVFVTVGTTSFDHLIRQVTSAECCSHLASQGYATLVIQKGRGTFNPLDGAAAVDAEAREPSSASPPSTSPLPQSSSSSSSSLAGSPHAPSGLKVVCFDYAPSLADHMRAADLVISHAGSGSIFEALRLQRPLVVVVNEALMDNHQQELASALAEGGHLLCCTPPTLLPALQRLETTQLQPYPPHEAHKFAQHLDRFLGFSSD